MSRRQELAEVVVAAGRGERLRVDVEVHVGLEREAQPELGRDRAAIDEGEHVAAAVGLGAAAARRR